MIMKYLKRTKYGQNKSSGIWELAKSTLFSFDTQKYPPEKKPREHLMQEMET